MVYGHIELSLIQIQGLRMETNSLDVSYWQRSDARMSDRVGSQEDRVTISLAGMHEHISLINREERFILPD